MIFLFLLFFQIGEEILVNDDTIGGAPQYYPAIVMDSSFNFYVIWEDFRASDYDNDLYLQKLDLFGNKIGTNINLIEDQPSRNIWNYVTGSGDIAISKDKIIVVYPDGRRGDVDIYCQFFNLNLEPISPMIILNDDGQKVFQTFPKVAIAQNHYIFVWEDQREEKRTIYGQILDSNFNPISANFRISEITGYEQFQPAISAYCGSFIVTWTQKMDNRCYLYGRRFTKTGIPLGNSFPIFPFSAKNSFCVMDKNGNFFVGGEEETGTYRNIYLVLFDSTGQQLTSPILINDTFPINWDRQPAIATLPDRRKSIIVWCDTREGCKIYGQFIDSLGNPIGSNFPISNLSPGQRTPKVALANETLYLAVWEDSREKNPDIYAFHPLRRDFKVNDDFASSIQDFMSVGIDELGNSLVIWMDYRNGTNDPDIYGQYFDNLGNKIGNNFRVNDDNEGNVQIFPFLAVNRKGKAVVVWRDNRDGNYNIYCQIFDENRQRVGRNFRVNQEENTSWPFVSINDSGDFIIGWEGGENPLPYCQLYRKDGQPIGSNYQIAERGGWVFPVIDNEKNFWVVWNDRGWVYLRKFDSLYNPLIPLIRVNSLNNGVCPFITKDTTGIIWVSWMDDRRGFRWEIFGRRCNENGVIGAEFKINDDNFICEHWFPLWSYDGDTTLYVTFTDFREEGNLNVMAQKFHISGRRIGKNYCIHNDPYPYVHQWAWKSCAANQNYVAYTWEDNRNLRSWDIYFKLVVNQIGISENSETVDKLTFPSVFLKREQIKVIKNYFDTPFIYDKNGNLVELKDLNKIPQGIYFLKEKKGARKIIIF
uniref:T9SS type A sorting domain-containing protein n=1 Tax=candidate division WOR-3 bacterium TaxID=2052148 RepID=A0A7C4W8F9_UNCW3